MAKPTKQPKSAPATDGTAALALFGTEELNQVAKPTPRTFPVVPGKAGKAAQASHPEIESGKTEIKAERIAVALEADPTVAPSETFDFDRGEQSFDRIMHISVESAVKVESDSPGHSTESSRFKAFVVGDGGELHLELNSQTCGATGAFAEAFALLEGLRENAVQAPLATTLIKATLPTRLHGAVKALLPGYLRQGFLDQDQAPVLERLGTDFQNPVPEYARPHLRELAELLRKNPLVVNW